MDDLIKEVATELMQAIKKNDVQMLTDALTAFVLHIQDQDKQQDDQDDQDGE